MHIVWLSCLLMSGCVIVTMRSPYDGQCPETGDKRLYDATQAMLSELDGRQFEALLDIKGNAVAKGTPCPGRYAAMYAEGYATGFAYFTLTKNWLRYWGRGTVEAATQRNAYVAGWYDGQLRARQERGFNPRVWAFNLETWERNQEARNRSLEEVAGEEARQ